MQKRLIHNMGTSASYSGPTGKNPLIPPWAEKPSAESGGSANEPEAVPQNPNGNENNPEVTSQNPTDPTNMTNISPLTSWRNVKSGFTRFARSTYSSPSSARKVTRNFVKAQGGSGNAATNSRKGRNVVQNIGGIFSGLAQQGSNFTYKGFNFQECVGKKASELLDTFVNLVVDDNDDLESMIARKATIETFNKIFEILGVKEKGFDALQNMTIDNVKLVFQTYLSEYILTNILQKVGQTLEKMPAKDAYQKEKWIKNYIATKVNLNLADKDVLNIDWKGKQGKDFVQNIFTEAYKLIE